MTDLALGRRMRHRLLVPASLLCIAATASVGRDLPTRPVDVNVPQPRTTQYRVLSVPECDSIYAAIIPLQNHPHPYCQRMADRAYDRCWSNSRPTTRRTPPGTDTAQKACARTSTELLARSVRQYRRPPLGFRRFYEASMQLTHPYVLPRVCLGRISSDTQYIFQRRCTDIGRGVIAHRDHRFVDDPPRNRRKPDCHRCKLESQ